MDSIFSIFLVFLKHGSAYMIPNLSEWPARLEGFLLSAIKCGRVPKHVAFIMDGNRRYARKQDIDTVKGHEFGFSKLEEVSNSLQNDGGAELS